MSNVYDFPQHSRHYDEAGIWIAKMDKDLTPAEIQALREWMVADPMNKEVLLMMARLWDKFSIMAKLSHIFPVAHRQQNIRPWRPFAFAASVILVLVVGVVVMDDRITEYLGGAEDPDAYATAVDSNIYETLVGERLTVILSDGSEAVLNTGSRVEVDYTDEYRLIHLERGEIHVDVSPDKSRPFGVVSDDTIIQALGTVFSVHNMEDGKLELIVVEGTVLTALIDTQASTSNNALLARAAQQSLAVAGGQRVILGPASEGVRSISSEEIEALLSWREGNIVFTGETLEDALAEISRYSPVEFEIADENLKNIKIAGRFRAGDLDRLLTALEVSFRVGHQRNKDGKVFLSRL